MFHMFYSQADDVCQFYVLSSLHFVLVLAQMSKPEKKKKKKHTMKNIPAKQTNTLHVFVSVTFSCHLHHVTSN